MRKKYMIGNWKLNQTVASINEFLDSFKQKKYTFTPMIAPQFIHLYQCINNVDTPFEFGSQTVSHFDKGAYTGEVSAYFLKDINAKFSLIGHSERRTLLYESEKLFHKKIKSCLSEDLQVVYCVGETLKQREEGKTLEIIQEQLQKALIEISVSNSDQIIIAYEPVWAIGTGKTATPQEANEVHQFINQKMAEIFPTFGKNISIIYGGSVKPTNIEELLQQDFIDGALVGGASLKADDFNLLCEAVDKYLEKA